MRNTDIRRILERLTRGKQLTITVQNPLEQTRIHRLPIPLLLNLLVHRQGQTGLAAGRVDVCKDILLPRH